MAAPELRYTKVLLVSRSGMSPGSLSASGNGFHWRRQDGKVVDVKKGEISSLAWTPLASNRCQLSLRRSDGSTVNFLGFKNADHDDLARLCEQSLGLDLQIQQLAIAGHNWGDLERHDRSLAFGVDKQVIFEVPLPDVSSVLTPSKDEVLLQFHVDDTTGNDKEDTLLEMAFHVPPGHDLWRSAAREMQETPGDKKTTAAMALAEELRRYSEAAAGGAGAAAVASFYDVSVLAPRGRFTVEMYPGHMKLTGQTQEYKIGYSSINRVFILPKPSGQAVTAGQTLVAVSLDPPIRKGNTYYSFLLCQFGSDDKMMQELNISDELLAHKNVRCGNKLQRTVDGAVATVFAHVLRGLSAAKITRAKMETFRNQAGDGCAVRCSYRADEGFLYPLDKGFFYIHKPAMVINHDQIDSVEFQRQGGGVVSSSVRTFDLLIKLKAGTSYQFRNIQRGEWEPLFSFINSRKIRIENLAEAAHGPRGPGAGIQLGEDMDAGLRAARAEADDEEDEDEDFDVGGEAMSDSSAGSLDEEVEGSGGSDNEVEMVNEEGIDVSAVMGNYKRGSNTEAAAAAAPKARKPKKSKPPKAPKSAAAAAADGEAAEEAEGGKKQRKPRKKKDPNAPKKALSGFMFFSNANRELIKTENPGIPFGQLLGEEWRKLSAKDKAPFEAQAATDKERYTAAMAEYRAAGGGAAAAAAEENEAANGNADEGGEDW